MNKTEILVSIGPACESREIIGRMIDEGMTIARVNFSHAPHDEAKIRYDLVREEATKRGKKVMLFHDLCGPRIRVGKFADESREISRGQHVTFYTQGAPDVTDEELPIRDPYLHNDVQVGGLMLFDSGKFKSKIINVDKNRQRITVEFLNGGELLQNKGINVPNTKLTTTSPTEKDLGDIEFAVKENPEYVAVSFAQSAKELNAVRSLLNPGQKVWAKVEDPIAVKNIDEIIQAADGIIVARGDLGVEVPQEDVPLIQKMMINKCNAVGKPVIVATQMLASMVSHPTPTRAEVSDIVNAILDGSNGIWVSEETTIGDYPVEVVKTMRSIANRIEHFIDNHGTKAEPFANPLNVLSASL